MWSLISFFRYFSLRGRMEILEPIRNKSENEMEMTEFGNRFLTLRHWGQCVLPLKTTVS